MVNNENVLSKETVNGVTNTHIHGSNRIFEKEVFTANPEYELMSRRGEVRLGTHLSTFKQLTTQMYPYVASQKMFCSRLFLDRKLQREKQDCRNEYGTR